MYQKLLFVFAILFAVSFAANTPAIRFVNALENTTIDIYTNSLKTITLNYTDVSEYQSVAGGSLQVTNIVNHYTSESYTGANPQLIGFLGNATVSIFSRNGTVYLIMMNETYPSTFDDTKAWIRLIDLGSDSNFITMADTAGAIASYVGSTVNTPYQNIDPTTTSLRIYYSATGSYNSPLITVNSDFNASCAYTVFYFTPSTGPVANLVFDRSFLGWSPAPSTSSTSGSSTSTSGASVTSGSSNNNNATMTTGVKATSTSSPASSTSTSTTSGFVSSTTTGLPQTGSAEQLVIAFTTLFFGFLAAF